MVSPLATEGLIFYYPESDVSLFSPLSSFEKIFPPRSTKKIIIRAISIPSLTSLWIIEESTNTIPWALFSIFNPLIEVDENLNREVHFGIKFLEKEINTVPSFYNLT